MGLNKKKTINKLTIFPPITFILDLVKVKVCKYETLPASRKKFLLRRHHHLLWFPFSHMWGWSFPVWCADIVRMIFWVTKQWIHGQYQTVQYKGFYQKKQSLRLWAGHSIKTDCSLLIMCMCLFSRLRWENTASITPSLSSLLQKSSLCVCKGHKGQTQHVILWQPENTLADTSSIRSLQLFKPTDSWPSCDLLPSSETDIASRDAPEERRLNSLRVYFPPT